MAIVGQIEPNEIASRAGEARERMSSVCGDSRGDQTTDGASCKHYYVRASTFMYYYFTYRAHHGIKVTFCDGSLPLIVELKLLIYCVKSLASETTEDAPVLYFL